MCIDYCIIRWLALRLKLYLDIAWSLYQRFKDIYAESWRSCFTKTSLNYILLSVHSVLQFPRTWKLVFPSRKSKRKKGGRCDVANLSYAKQQPAERQSVWTRDAFWISHHSQGLSHKAYYLLWTQWFCRCPLCSRSNWSRSQTCTNTLDQPPK